MQEQITLLRFKWNTYDLLVIRRNGILITEEIIDS